jgi:protein TonB
MPDLHARPRPIRATLPSGRGWMLVGAAVVLGGVLFAATLVGRDEAAPGGADDLEAPAATAAPAWAPLPVPRARDAGEARAAARPTPVGEEMAVGGRIEETAPAAAADTAPVAAPEPVVVSASAPVPIETPDPRYPRRALRRGVGGDVLLRIEVDARGIPARVEVLDGSGDGELDRAARRAVMDWRFRPAMRDGTPVAGVVNVPIRFDPRR